MKQKRIFIIMFAALLSFVMLPLTAFAASASVSAPSSVSVGDTFSVKVKFSGTNIGAVQAAFSYDSSVIKYVSGSGTSNGKIVLYTSAEGASSLSTTIKFRALKTGKSTISVSASEILAFDESPLGSAKASDTVTVTEKSTESPSPSASKPSEPSPSPSVNPVEQAMQVTVDGQTLYLWTILIGVTPPPGFNIVDSVYQNQKIQAVSANNLTLAYLTDQKGGTGSFYVLDKDTLYPYLPISQNKTFAIVKPGSSAVVPNGYSETTIKLNDRDVQAWKSDKFPDFYLLYTMNTEGKKDFYTYDSIEGTLQRYTDRTVVVEVEKEPTVAQPEKQKEVQTLGFFKKLQSDPVLLAVFIILAGLIVILIIICILLFSKKRKIGSRVKLMSEKDKTQKIE